MFVFVFFFFFSSRRRHTRYIGDWSSDVCSSDLGTALQSWISDACDADEQGTVQGALTGISALAEAGVPVLATAVFAGSLAVPVPGLVLVLAGLLPAASALVLTRAPAPPPLAHMP